MHLLSIPLLATVALAASNVLRPFVPVILPVGTIVNQQNPKPTFGVIVDTIDAYQSFNFDLKVPNGTLYAGVAKFSLPCGVAGSVTSSKFPFDKYNDTPGNYVSVVLLRVISTSFVLSRLIRRILTLNIADLFLTL